MRPFSDVMKPFMLSAIRAMLIEAGGIRLGFLTASIKEVIRLKSQTAKVGSDQDPLEWESAYIPILRLGQWLTFNCSSKVTY